MNKILCSTGALLVYGGDYRLLEPLRKIIVRWIRIYDGCALL